MRRVGYDPDKETRKPENLENEIQNLQQANFELQETLSELRNMKGELETEVDSLKAQLIEKDEEIKKLKKKNGEQSKRLKEVGVAPVQPDEGVEAE